jgi:hypothetical protein
MRLLIRQREDLTEALLARAFDQRERNVNDALAALALEAYEAHYGRAEVQAMDRLPEGWLPTSKSLRFELDDRTHTVELGHPVRVPARDTGMQYSFPLRSVDLPDRLRTLLARRTELARERQGAKTETMALLRKFSSVEQLRKQWPEARSIIDQVILDTPEPSSGLPMVAELNRRLDLPPDDQEEAA